MGQTTLDLTASLVSAGVRADGAASVNLTLADEAKKFSDKCGFAVSADGKVRCGKTDLGDATAGEKSAITAFKTAMDAMVARLDDAGKLGLGN